MNEKKKQQVTITMKMIIPGIDKEESNRGGEDWDWDLRLEKFDNGRRQRNVYRTA